MGANDMYTDEDIIKLTFEDGSEVECIVQGVFEVQGVQYVALEVTDDDEIFFYRYIETDDGYEMGDIIDDNEFERVTKEFNRLLEEDL